MCALMDALRARIENQKYLKRYTVLSKPTTKCEEKMKNEASAWEDSMSPVQSLNGKNIPSEANSSNLGHSSTGIKAGGNKGIERTVINGASNSEGFTEGPDTENEDDEDDENEEDAGTWKSSKSPIKNSIKAEIIKLINVFTPPKEPVEMTHSEKLSKSSIFSKLESPHRVREIPILIGSVFRNTGSDIKLGVENVYKELKEKVEVVSANLEAESEDLKNLSQRPVTHDPLDLPMIKLFIGISGPYNLLALSSHMQSRGLDHSILKWICRGDVKKYSPVLHLDSIMSSCLSSVSSPTSSERKLLGKGFSSKENPANIGTKCFFDDHDTFDYSDKKSSQKIIPDATVTNSVTDHSSVRNTDIRSESISSSSKYSVSCDNEKCFENENENINENENEDGFERATLNGMGFPPVALFHGAEDISVPSSVSVEMAAALCRWGGEVRAFALFERDTSVMSFCLRVLSTVVD